MTTALAATAKAPQPDVGDEDIQKIQNRIREIMKCIDGENEVEDWGTFAFPFATYIQDMSESLW